MPADFLRSATDMGGVHLVTLQGELDLATNEGLADWLVEISGSMVVVDLSGVTFINSSGIGALIAAKNRIRDAGDDLVLTRPQPNVKRVFDITGLSGLFVDWDSAWNSTATIS